MKKIFFSLSILFVTAYLLVFPVKAADNKYGVAVSQYYSEKGFSDSAKWKMHLDWAQNMVGQGGYVKLFFPWIGDQDAPLETYKQVVQETYARNLNPIVRVQGTWVTKSGKNEGLTGCWARPPQDSSTTYSKTAGKYTQYAQKVVDFVDSLPTPPQGRIMYVELWNEMNYDYIEWCDEDGNSAQEPENYARFYLEVYNRLNALGKPNIKLATGGLGRGGPQEYLDRMLSTVFDIVGKNPSTLQNIFQNFSIHVYPPTTDDQSFRGGIHYYYDQLRIFSKYNVDPNNLNILVTEGGYIRPTTNAQEDERQARLNEELVKELAKDSRISAITLFSLDDYTDRRVTTTASPLDDVLLVRADSGSGNTTGMPSNPRPAYITLKKLMTGSENPITPPQDIRPIGYVVSEDLAAVNSLNTPSAYTSFPITIDYTLQNTTPGQKVIYVKFFYSDGRSRIETTELTYEPTSQARVCNPGEVQTMCKRTQCSVGQQVTNPSDVLGVQIAANCSNGQTFYSCSDIKCPDGSVAPGGGCYPDNYLSDCLANCPGIGSTTTVSAATPSPAPASSNTAQVAPGICPDQCFSDELRLGVGKNSSGQCDSGVQSTSYICRAGAVGQQRACGGTQYVCVDGQGNGFYWSQIGAAPADSSRPAGPIIPPVDNSGYQTTFKCNDQGTGWVCTAASPNTNCTK